MHQNMYISQSLTYSPFIPYLSRTTLRLYAAPTHGTPSTVVPHVIRHALEPFKPMLDIVSP